LEYREWLHVTYPTPYITPAKVALQVIEGIHKKRANRLITDIRSDKSYWWANYANKKKPYLSRLYILSFFVHIT